MLELLPQVVVFGGGILLWSPPTLDRCPASLSASVAAASLCSLPRDGTVAPREEGEESESPLREQDLKEAYIQLVHGVQEWPDGCVYRGEFGLNMKLGYGEFSWPTGEVSGLNCGSHYLLQGLGLGLSPENQVMGISGHLHRKDVG